MAVKIRYSFNDQTYNQLLHKVSVYTDPTSVLMFQFAKPDRFQHDLGMAEVKIWGSSPGSGAGQVVHNRYPIARQVDNNRFRAGFCLPRKSVELPAMFCRLSQVRSSPTVQSTRKEPMPRYDKKTRHAWLKS